MKICPKCKERMQQGPRWYGCLKCDKPKSQTVITYDLFAILYWAEAMGRPGLKKRVLDYIHDDIKGNDTTIYVNFEDRNYVEDEELREDLNFLAKEFGESFYADVSW